MKNFLGPFVCVMIFSKILNAGETPIRFTENKGQVSDQFYKPRPDILFYGQAGPLNFFIREDGISYQLSKMELKDNGKEETIYRVDMKMLQPNHRHNIVTQGPLAGYENFYLQQCAEGALNVRSYEGITLRDMYTGIDAHYYAKNGALKYDYIVAPGADYAQIKFKVEGAEVRLEKEELVMYTPFGEIREQKPVAFQDGREVKAEWELKDGIIGFKIASYDHSKELIIDPILRVWGTYYGGNAEDEISEIKVDASGNVYCSGFTVSSGAQVIATTGAHQTTYGGGTHDAFLLKLNSAGARLWATYYGGSGEDEGNDCALDLTSNHIYLYGSTTTTASSVIAGNGGHQSTSGGTGSFSKDAFLAKFNSSGTRVWGTFYGGNGAETGFSCETDISGNIYISGTTSSTAAISTVGAHQQTFGGGNDDAFLVKFNSSGVRQWGTYYGNNDDALSNVCTTDAFGNVFLGGATNSTINALATNGSHQPTPGGFNDCILVKFNGNGVRQWATYYGGDGGDYIHALCTDGSGNVFISGNCTSTVGTVISTPGSYQPVSGALNGYDAYLAAFNSSGVRQWGTYYGGAGGEHVRGLVTDSIGNIYMAGYTSTATAASIMASTGTYQDTNGGGFDAFVAKFKSNGFREWGTFYGGSGDDRSKACAVDSRGFLYTAGASSTSSGTIIASNGAYQTTNGGGITDAFLVKFRNCPPLQYGGPNLLNFCEGDLAIFSLNPPASVTQTLTGPGGFSSTLTTSDISNIQSSNAGIYTLTLSDATGCKESYNITVNVSICTSIETNSGSKIIYVFPNPGNGLFLIENEMGPQDIRIYDAKGQLIKQVHLKTGQNELNLSDYSAGIYILKTGSDNFKIVKE